LGGTPAAPQVTRESDIIHWWKFDDGSGSEATDSVGTAHLDANGGADWAGTSNALFGDAGQGDGYLDSWRVADEFNFNNAAYTMTGWFYPTRNNKGTYYSTAWSIDTSIGLSSPGPMLSWSGVTDADDNYFKFTQVKHPSGWISATSTNALTINNWYFIATAWDGSNVIKLYVGRKGTDSDPILYSATGATSVKNTTSNDSIGLLTAFSASYANNAAGRIDDVRFYGDELSADDIADIYNGGDGDIV